LAHNPNPETEDAVSTTTIARRPEAPKPESEVLRDRAYKSTMRLYGVVRVLQEFGDTDESIGRVLELLAVDVEREIELLDDIEAFLLHLPKSKKAGA
jgi:hypothetical protein